MLGPRAATRRGGVKCLLASTFALTAVMAASPVWGFGYTLLNDPPSGEDSHLEIVSDIYVGHGGAFAADGLGFRNDVAGITLERVYDFDSAAHILHILFGDEMGVDQIWTDGQVTVTAQAKFAGHSQSFGWNDNGGSSGTEYVELLTEANIGDPAVEVTVLGEFLWGTQPDGDQWWSRDSLNSDGRDHLLSYFVKGLPDADGEAVWLLFWEDLPCGDCDQDFNDFVVEVRGVPEPRSFLLLGAGLTGLAIFGRRRSTA